MIGLQNLVIPPWATIALKILPWALLAPLFLLGQCSGARNANAKNQAARAVANVAIVQQDGSAKEVSAAERVTDKVLVDANHKELIDAIQQAPDSAPDASRVAFGCARLRQSGRDEASLPLVCRPAGGVQAGSH
jgi:hypothetical protein